ncbi:MAG: hypothetical protein AAGH99_16190 [Planctomycetota bacterium]
MVGFWPARTIGYEVLTPPAVNRYNSRVNKQRLHIVTAVSADLVSVRVVVI